MTFPNVVTAPAPVPFPNRVHLTVQGTVKCTRNDEGWEGTA